MTFDKSGPSVIVSTTGVYGLNIQAPGNVLIDTTAGTVSVDAAGNSLNGAIQGLSSSAGSVTINAGNVTSTGTAAIFAGTQQGDVSINTTAGTINTNAAGNNLNGAIVGQAFAGGNVQIITGNVQAIGATAVSGQTPVGNVSIDTTAGTVHLDASSGPQFFGAAIQAFGGASGAVGVGSASVKTADVTTVGANATAINAFGYGSVQVDTTKGVVSTAGSNATGIMASALSVDGTTPYQLQITTGDVTTTGDNSPGAQAIHYAGNATYTIDTTRGAIVTQGKSSPAVYMLGFIGGESSRITTGSISTTGAVSPGVLVADAPPNFFDPAITWGVTTQVNTTGGAINTAGDSSHGIFVLNGISTANVTVDSGPVTTTGPFAFGVAAAALGTTCPSFATNCHVLDAPPVSITSHNPISATGDNAGGIVALSYAQAVSISGATPTGNVNIAANANIAAPGRNSVGIAAASSNGTVSVTVGNGVSVLGGWSQQSGDLSSISTAVPVQTPYIGSNLPAAGIVVYSGATWAPYAMTITNNGNIGAMNDRAITMGYTCAGENGPGCDYLAAPGAAMAKSQALHVINNGTITGYVTYLPADPHVFDNAGMFAVRNFADTTGTGVRDTKAVSISDFGGPSALFNNLSTGTVQLAPVANAANVNAAGYYVPTTGINSRPLDASVYNLSRQGIVQGQFVNLATFDNAGTIDLRGPVVGNTLVITGNAAAGGAAGTGVFVSDGGRLLVNATLNDGLPLGGQTNSAADVLVVDSTKVGAGGATTVSVTNVGGTGAVTPGNGIEIVEVRNKAAGMSAQGAFALAQAVPIGAFDYNLYQNGVGADSSDGNWYLRTIPAPVKPLLSPTAQTTLPYTDVLSHFAQATLGTLQQRTGNRIWPGAAAPIETIWCKDPAQNFRCTPTEKQASVYAGGAPAPLYGQGAWGRIVGQYSSYSPKVGSSYTQALGFLQTGYEGVAYGNASGDVTVGAYATAGTSSAKIKVTPDPVSGRARPQGTIDTDAYGIGTNVTWLGKNGLYADAVGQFTWYNSDLSNKNGGNDGWSSALSLEVGKRFDLNAGWAIVPQAQLAWTHVDFSNFSDKLGNAISIGRGDSLQGRVGARIENLTAWNAGSHEARRLQFYGIANLEYEFLRGSSVKIAGTSIVQQNQRLWGEVGAGANYAWNDKWSIYGEADYSHALSGGGGDSYTVKGTAGLRYMW